MKVVDEFQVENDMDYDCTLKVATSAPCTALSVELGCRAYCADQNHNNAIPKGNVH